MQYKTIAMELLEQHPQFHETLKRDRRLLEMIESLARELKATHEQTISDLSERQGPGPQTWLLRKHGRSFQPDQEGVWAVFATGNWASGRLTMCSPFNQTRFRTAGNGCDRAGIRKFLTSHKKCCLMFPGIIPEPPIQNESGIRQVEHCFLMTLVVAMSATILTELVSH